MACLAAALLEHGTASSGGGKLPQGKQLAVVEGSIVQSALGVLREMIARGEERGNVAILACFRATPDVLGARESRTIKVMDMSRMPGTSLAEIRAHLDTLVGQVPPSRTSFYVDSIEGLLEASGASVAETYRFLSGIMARLPMYARLVVGSDVDASRDAQGVCAALTSPQFWNGQEPDELGSGNQWSHATLCARLHPPALVRHLYSSYGLVPPTSGAALYRAAHADAGTSTQSAPDDRKADARFWSVLHSVAGRGPFGLDDDRGWWSAVRAPASRLQAMEAPAPPLGPVLFAEEALGLHSDTADAYSTGYGYLEVRAALSTGKHVEELAALAYGPQRRLKLHALDMDTSNVQVAAPAADPHASLVQQLPFNLNETPQQRERREQVSLPYAYQLHDTPAPESAWRGSTGQSAIFFEPESEDDEDDEDPDDDLDV